MVKTFGVIARPKAPQGYSGQWVNMYRRGKYFFAGGAYKTRKHADVISKKHRHDCVYIHVRIENG